MKVSELKGAQLDYWVAMSAGHEASIIPPMGCRVSRMANGLRLVEAGAPGGLIWEPSTNWAQAGIIIERERISLSYDDQGGRERGYWMAYAYDDHEMMLDESPLVAAMRAYVRSKFGNEVAQEGKAS